MVHVTHQFPLVQQVLGAAEFAPEGDGGVVGWGDDEVVVDALGQDVEGEGVGGLGDGVEEGGQGGGAGGGGGGGAGWEGGGGGGGGGGGRGGVVPRWLSPSV